MKLKEAIKLIINTILNALKSGGTVDIPSPRDIVDYSDIKYLPTKKRITIDNILPDVWLTGVLDTNSMDGLLDFGHTVILSNNPIYLDNIAVGDVVVWYKEGSLVIHQVVETGDDSEWWCYTKGLNVSKRDPFKIRKENIRWVGLGIIW